MNEVRSTGEADNQMVLIDTWWNVNKPMDHAAHRYSFVLIDTWWNVNQVDKWAG